MDSLVIATIERTAKSWRTEAEERRRISKADPIADTLDYCAGELSERVRAIKTETQFETVEQRAKREHVTPQTVRIWIRKGQLAAEDGPKGYRIPVTAKRLLRAG